MSVMGDRPTPRSIAVSALIALRSDPSSPLHEIEFNPHEQDKMTAFLEDSVFQSVAPLPFWMRNLRHAMGVEVSELLLDTLYLASESVDSLVDLVDSLCAAVVEGLVDPVSVHGVYLRQVCVGFDQLSFESVTFLWQALCDQLDVVPDLRGEAIYLTEESVMPVHEQNELASQSWPLSTTQVEDLLQQTCRQLGQAHFSFERVELQIRSMLDKAPDASAAHFLRFLNCLRHNDRTALEALHQFFDHTMIQRQSSTKEILQFSAILLSLVHDSFGDQTVALMATEEAVRVAQQAKDQTCVAFALGKLFQNEGQGASGRRELLKRCAVRASQEQIRPLIIGSSLGLSVNYLEDENRDPSIVWRHHMEATAEPTADSMPSWDRPTCLSHSPQETTHGLARQALIESGIWDSLGIPELSGLASLAVLNCHHQSSAEEIISAITDLARLSYHGTQSSRPSDCTMGAVAAVSRLLQAEHLPGLDGLDGKSCIESFLPHLIFQLHDQSTNVRDLQKAKTLENILRSSLPPRLACQGKFMFEIGIQTCCRLCQSQDWSTARFLALDLLQWSMIKTVQRPKVLILIAGIELESTANRFVSALPHLLEAIAICQESSMYDLHAVALLVLASVFLRMRNPKRALSILKGSIPVLLPRAQKSQQAEAYLTEAKCYIQLADSLAPSAQRPMAAVLKKRKYQAAFEGLKTCERLFRLSQNDFRLVEVYYLQARILFFLDRMQECETVSREYLMLQQVKSANFSQFSSLCSILGVLP